MTTDAEHLLDELLQLPQDDRLAIAAILADSVQHEPTADIEASWLAEAKRRLQAVREGRSTTIPTELVEDELVRAVDHRDGVRAPRGPIAGVTAARSG